MKDSFEQFYITKEDCYRLCFNLQVDCLESVLTPSPRLLHLYDWQLKMNQQSILKEPDRWLVSLERTKEDRTLADQKKVRNLKFRVEHANRKGRSRCQSLAVKAKETLDENLAKTNPKHKLAKP